MWAAVVVVHEVKRNRVRWFYIVVAACAVVISLAAALTAIVVARYEPPHQPDHWELVQAGNLNNGVFNAVTGTACTIVPDSTHSLPQIGCIDLTGGGVDFLSKYSK